MIVSGLVERIMMLIQNAKKNKKRILNAPNANLLWSCIVLAYQRYGCALNAKLDM
jgi:hypothetical protein